MTKVAVVIRQLSGHKPVASAVIVESKDPEIDDMDHYLNSQAQEHIAEFKKQFVEFRDHAEWSIQLMDTL